MSTNSMVSKRNLLTLLIFAALVLGVVIGHFFLYEAAPTDADKATVQAWKTAGQIVFLRPLQLLIVPLIFTSVLTGITSIGDPKKLGLLGGATIFYYSMTMVAAVGLGVLMAIVANPGAGLVGQVDVAATLEAGASAAQGAPEGSASQGLGSAWLAILYQMVPNNFLQSAVEVQALSIITATMLLGVGVVAVGQKAEPFKNAIDALHEVLMTIVMWVIWLMPLGVLLLVAAAVGEVGLETLTKALARYIVIVLGGLSIHMLVTLSLILWLATRTNPFRYMWNIKTALLTAFGTSSSMATLPVTIETAAEAGCSKRSAGLVLPLGATVNMDGTALYQGITVIFLFQAFGYELHMTEYVVVVLTATLAAVGAAGVPGGSLATIMIIITAVNTTLGAQGGDFEPLPLAAVGLILPVDRFLDMCRTMVNVWGDSVGARIITRLAPDTEEAREAAFA
ncbi:MAG: dicarboxylate/amino acid:cation symporter [Phycisphaerales bacterium]